MTLTYSHHDAAEARQLLPEMIDVYEDVYAAELDNPFDSTERWVERFHGHSSRYAYELVTVRDDGRMIGFIYGMSLPPDTHWWDGLVQPLPDELATWTREGRVMALPELMVRQPYRRQGIARRLHDELIKERPEAIASLLVDKDNVSARTAYQHWGWAKVGDLQPFPDAPLFDALVKYL